MRKIECFAGNRRGLPLAGLVLLGIAVVIGLWVGVDWRKSEFASKAGVTAEAGGNILKIRKPKNGEKLGGGGGVDETTISGGQPSPQSFAGTSRQPLQFRAKAVEPAGVLAVLMSGKQTVEERAQELQRMRGISFSKEQRESSMAFLAGKNVPEGMGKGSMQWLADELLTALRLQEPPWDGLAAELGKAAFQPGTDPVVRDYIMQHLGHLWEQYGARNEIGKSLWKAVSTSDETTPGTALIALSRGYARDQQDKPLADVRQRALALAADPNTALAVRVTALSIAGDGGSAEVKKLADSLIQNSGTPVILRKVAERVVR